MFVGGTKFPVERAGNGCHDDQQKSSSMVVDEEMGPIMGNEALK